MLNHRQAFLRWAKKQWVCGIILEVCRFNTERPLSGLGVENKKKRNHSGHHTPHHPTTLANRKTLSSGKHKARRGKKNDYNSQRGKSVSGLFCSGGACRVHFLFPHFCLGCPPNVAWAGKLGAKKFFNQQYVDFFGDLGNKKSFCFCVDSFSLIGILKRGKVGNQIVPEPRQINVLLTARKVATPPLNVCFSCFFFVFSNNLALKGFQKKLLQKYVRGS